jgi:hypothetical protein
MVIGFFSGSIFGECKLISPKKLADLWDVSSFLFRWAGYKYSEQRVIIYMSLRLAHMPHLIINRTVSFPLPGLIQAYSVRPAGAKSLRLAFPSRPGLAAVPAGAPRS